jgi:DNA repair photolyase
MIREIQAKSILNRSRIPGIDYAVNPYLGCLHACVYCYARFMCRFTGHGEPWGTFCDVKTNAAERLAAEVFRSPRGLVSLSTVTDPYQAPEARYRLTRRLLGILADAEFPVSILTKSDRVADDLDVLRRFPEGKVDVGFTMNTLDESVRRHFEPGAPAVERRVEAMRRLHAEGIRTWVFVAPFLPVLSERSIQDLFAAVRGAADHVLVDALNIKCGNWPGIRDALGRSAPDLAESFRTILFSPKHRGVYFSRVFDAMQRVGESMGLDVRVC